MDLETSPPSPSPSRIAHAFVVALITTAAVASLRRGAPRADFEVAELPSAVRLGLRDRTVQTLREVCAAARGPELHAFCGEQAALLLRMRECDASCAALARSFAPHATR